MLVPICLLIGISLCLALALTPLVRILAIRWDLVDHPDDHRKVHKQPIPRVGGIAIALAYSGALLAIGILLHFYKWVPSTTLATVKSIAPAAFFIFLTGLADDILDLKPRHKFIAQIVVAIMAVVAGVHFPGVQGSGVFSVLVAGGSTIWLVLCTNAINLIDGLDGLAGGMALLATLAILFASIVSGDTGLALATAPLGAALLGFLVFNFNPASIFLGDSGSLLLGFLLGCYSILWTHAASHPLNWAAPLMVMAVPISDVTLAVSRRYLRRQPIFKADRSHIHHRLLAKGLSHKRTVLVLYSAASAAGTLALCLILGGARWEPMVLITFAAAAVFGVQQLGYVEFDALRRVVLRGGLRREITVHLAVQTLEARLASASTADDCWTILQAGCREFGFYAVGMNLAGSSFDCPADDETSESWAMRVPISTSDWIKLSHSSEPVRYPTALVPFVHTIRHVLGQKSAAWSSHNERARGFEPAFYTTVS